MSYETELNSLLPTDLPNRAATVAQAAAHLRLIEAANLQFNLTRITTPREAAIKHVLDSLLPWRLFKPAHTVLDAGTGAGFPGIPLALALPDTQFTLADSTQKKARFVEAAIQELQIGNITVSSARAEELLAKNRYDLTTARAVAPMIRAIPLFARALQSGSRLLLYKGPDVEQEIAEAAHEARKCKVCIEVAMRYELPDQLGARTIVLLTPQQ